MCYSNLMSKDINNRRRDFSPTLNAWIESRLKFKESETCLSANENFSEDLSSFLIKICLRWGNGITHKRQIQKLDSNSWRDFDLTTKEKKTNPKNFFLPNFFSLLIFLRALDFEIFLLALMLNDKKKMRTKLLKVFMKLKA